MTRSTRLCHTSLTWLKAENIPPRPSSPITPGSCSTVPGLFGKLVCWFLCLLLGWFLVLCGAGGHCFLCSLVSSRIRVDSSPLGVEAHHKRKFFPQPTLDEEEREPARQKECSRHLF